MRVVVRLTMGGGAVDGHQPLQMLVPVFITAHRQPNFFGSL